MSFFIDDTCVGCTACVARCPVDAIQGDRKIIHDIDPGICIDCGACAWVCPEDSIHDQFGTTVEHVARKAWPIAAVDDVHCVGCAKCVDECPYDCLYLVNIEYPGSFFTVVEVREKDCVGCRICEWACPYDAIFIYRKDNIPDWISESRVNRLSQEGTTREAARRVVILQAGSHVSAGIAPAS